LAYRIPLKQSSKPWLWGLVSAFTLSDGRETQKDVSALNSGGKNEILVQ
jgi:hypothetical protein